MVDFALIFPGQGAQYIGMGKDLYQNFPAAKVIFEKANHILGFDITKFCFEGPKGELTRSDVCQPAILTASIAALRALESVSPFLGQLVPKAVLGLSLGEYTALVTAGSISFEDAVSLVRKRGQFMEEASRQNPGTMASVIGFPLEDTKKVCLETGAEIANLNSPGQIVISGTKEKIEAASNLAKERGARKVIPLDVSGAFHSGLMEPAAQRLKAEIDKIEIKPPKVRVVTNVNAGYESSPDEIRKNLVMQVKSPVLWEGSIRFLAGQGLPLRRDVAAGAGIKRYIEVGPGKVLAGLLRRIDPALECLNVETSSDVSAVKEVLSQG
ncbi:MAG: [acyl-carrier-protein] S-malonyltransferase [Omnitrophica WOR_2 bacterium RIFCSPLOWO2_12_FULL_51_24]|nr:MAG: [acyl-carrier-protein] S-malonyltransferase [Omnitrophica WOR_2 bacterium RIFCSPHIGHO2_01_FULL_49_10]OGX42264.1 MAG: [acyl-carrier-protein] S-malonyltransferase [Omnitrophica WOR_2 bacterium RIFCSPLOWO2_12_FULL_51_24]